MCAQQSNMLVLSAMIKFIARIKLIIRRKEGDDDLHMSYSLVGDSSPERFSNEDIVFERMFISSWLSLVVT